MGQFFGSMYCLFEDFFGLELANYLWGQAAPEQQTNMFIGIGFSMLALSLFVVVLFYYIVNHPKMANWWSWLIFLAGNAVINFLVGWRWVLSDYYAGFMVSVDPATNQTVPLNIGEGDILCFGVSNMLLSIVAFILFSYIVKWWSTNVSNAPF